jgi:hypothetical protein
MLTGVGRMVPFSLCWLQWGEFVCALSATYRTRECIAFFDILQACDIVYSLVVYVTMCVLQPQPPNMSDCRH